MRKKIEIILKVTIPTMKLIKIIIFKKTIIIIINTITIPK